MQGARNLGSGIISNSLLWCHSISAVFGDHRPRYNQTITRPQFHRLDFAVVRGQNRSMADEHSRRTDKLEANLSHLEHQVEQLKSVVIEQGKLLERLKKDVQRQTRAMESLELERIQQLA